MNVVETSAKADDVEGINDTSLEDVGSSGEEDGATT